MATPERALLDSIDRPQFSGGLAEVSRIVAKAPARISWRVLLGYAKNWGESALVQRLGYLLDLHEVEVPASARKALIKLVNPTSKVHLGSRREWGTSGRLVQPWSIVENVPRDRLVETRAVRRAVKPFAKRAK